MGTFNITKAYRIRQGTRYELTLLYPGNIASNVGLSIRSQIRNTYGGTLLAQFQVGAIAYDAEADKTSILLFLTAAQTKTISATEATQYWVWDAEIVLGTGQDPIRALEGKVEVDPEVTLDA